MYMIYYHVLNVHQNFSGAEYTDAVISAFSFRFFLFPQLPFLLSLRAGLWPYPLVCPSLPFWDITLLLMLPGENIIHSYPGM